MAKFSDLICPRPHMYLLWQLMLLKSFNGTCTGDFSFLFSLMDRPLQLLVLLLETHID
jgi:hypothetical protein